MATAAEETEALPADRPFSLSRFPILLVIRGIASVLLAVFVFAVLHYYIGERLIIGAGLTGWPAVFAWTALALCFLSIPLGLAAGRLAPRGAARVFQWAAYIWLGAFGILLSACVFTDIGRAVLFALGHPLSHAGRAQAEAISGLAGPALAYGLYRARAQARLERIQVPIRGLGAGIEGLRIVQISDIHIGPTLDGKFLRRVVEQVNGLSPDVIVITGDLIDAHVAAIRDEVAPLRDLRARHGVFFVTGNHEYYNGVREWLEELPRLGITVLQNEHRVIERGGDRLVLAGVPDHNGGWFSPDHAPDPAQAFRGAPEGIPRILLAHQPRTAQLAAPHRVALQLSGHTHGGQMFPFIFFVRLQQPVIRGMKEIHGVRVYTHRGTGYWGPPIRLGSAPEIAELTLVKA